MTEPDANLPAEHVDSDSEQQPTDSRVRSSPVPESGTVVGIQAALYVQLILTVIVGTLFYPLAMAFSALGGSTTADIHNLTVCFIGLTAIPASLHLLAAIQIGRAKWGGQLAVSIFGQRFMRCE